MAGFWIVPAAFAASLCGYRTKAGVLTANPNMSDASDSLSVKLGTRLLDELGVQRRKPAPEQDIGTLLETRVHQTLAALRPDLLHRRSEAASSFDQYRHLGVLSTFLRQYSDSHDAGVQALRLVEELRPSHSRTALRQLVTGLIAAASANDAIVRQLRRDTVLESMLNVDVTVGIPAIGSGTLTELAVGLSSKWSLRTDRAQDCVSQGGRLVNLRRGRMPHFAVVTMEPRPSMLKILADGSGSVDCVYHLDLHSLTSTIEGVAAESRGARPGWADTFQRLIDQRRLRDFDDLLSEVRRLPGPATAQC